MKFADADGASYRTIERRRQSDLEFLSRIRTATAQELLALLANHSHKSAPEWRVIALKRAIARTAP